MVYYMDIMNTYERMGDFMINISQDLERPFVNKWLLSIIVVEYRIVLYIR